MRGIAYNPKKIEKSAQIVEKHVTLDSVNYVSMSIIEKESEVILLDEDTATPCEILLFNDDVNTFDHVIKTLITVCDHSPEQAEQCSLIVHYNGKCTVKTGAYSYLRPKCSKLLQAGLSAEIV